MPQWDRPPGGMRFRPAQSPKHPHRSTLSWDAVTSRPRPTRAAHAVSPTLGGPGEVDAFEGLRHRARARAVMITELLCEGAVDLCPIEGR